MKQSGMPSIQELSLGDLLEGMETKYSIPRYQREYAWSNYEIERLLIDLWSAFQSPKSNRYYLGTLVVCPNEYGELETIDGQQRLTTLALLFGMMKCFRNAPIVRFDTRDKCNSFLQRFCKDGSLPPDGEGVKSFLRAVSCIRDFKYSDENGVEHKISFVDNEFKNFLLTRVILFQVMMPKGTDAMAYFEVMNNRGEQLEDHELLKAKLLGRLHEKGGWPKNITYSDMSRKFNRIWTACSNMNGHLIDHLHTCYTFIEHPGYSWINSEIDESSHGDIDEIDVPYERQSVIRDFSQFLMHVIRLYRIRHPEKFKKNNGEECQQIPLDERRLNDYLETDFEPVEFLDLLIQTRLVFDRYVVKSKMQKGNVVEWCLREIIKSKDGSYYPRNTFSDLKKDDSRMHKKILNLESALQVSNADQRFKEWVYTILSMNESERQNGEKLLKELMKFTAQRISESKKRIAQASDYYAQGLGTPRLLFNLIDYLMWEKSEVMTARGEKFDFKVGDDFFFTYQNSIEHHTPQDQKYLKDDWTFEHTHDIGNLYLVSSSENSALSNHSPEEKVNRYSKRHQNFCPKRKWMYEQTINGGWTWKCAKKLSDYVREIVEEFMSANGG